MTADDEMTRSCVRLDRIVPLGMLDTDGWGLLVTVSLSRQRSPFVR